MYKCRYKDGIKINVKEVGYEGVNWIYVAQDGDWFRELLNKK
jgi:hypothetical protein